MNDVLWVYGTHNRRFYNELTLPGVLHECTHSDRFKHLLLIDDNSSDGTNEAIDRFDLDRILSQSYTRLKEVLGNSYQQWNIATQYAQEIGGIKYIMNMCNDQLYPEGIVDEFANILDANPDAFAVGCNHTGHKYVYNGISTQWPFIGHQRDVRDCQHIGAGMVRLSDMLKVGGIEGSSIKGEERFFGFTQYQHLMKKHYGKRMLWAHHVRTSPLDKMGAYSKNDDYIRNGYSRRVVSGYIGQPIQPFDN